MNTGQGAQRYIISDNNPNVSGSCLCYPHGNGEDAGGPFVIFTAAEVDGLPGNYNAVACAGCIKGACSKLDGEALSAGEAPSIAPPAGHQFLTSAPVDPQPLPEPHVNPSADTLEEAQRLIDEAREQDKPAI